MYSSDLRCAIADVLILVPSVCIMLGLLIAVLADSLRWGVIAKTFIFVPLAISFVGAAVIWRNIFAGGGIEALQTVNGATPSYQVADESASGASG